MQPDQCLVSPEDAARMLNVGAETIRRWMDLKVLHFKETDRHERLIDMQDLLDFANRHGIPVGLHPAAPARPSILIVDDEEDFLKLLAMMISQHRPDIDVFTTSSGFYAGVLVIRHRPTLILLDIHMPEMDGVEVCRIIKGDPTMKDIRVVAVTGETDSATLQSVRDAGAADVIIKPVKHEAIQALIDAVFSRLGHPR